jgi:squalene cyclase
MVIYLFNFIYLQDKPMVQRIVNWLFSKSCSDLWAIFEHYVIKATGRGCNKINQVNFETNKGKKKNLGNFTIL